MGHNQWKVNAKRKRLPLPRNLRGPFSGEPIETMSAVEWCARAGCEICRLLMAYIRDIRCAVQTVSDCGHTITDPDGTVVQIDGGVCPACHREVGLSR